MGGWDHHSNLKGALANHCAAIDKPIAGLLADLKGRGLLDDTLVLWGGEFGRAPSAQGDGRDHNNKGYTTWMAGGGVKSGGPREAAARLGLARRVLRGLSQRRRRAR